MSKWGQPNLTLMQLIFFLTKSSASFKLLNKLMAIKCWLNANWPALRAEAHHQFASLWYTSFVGYCSVAYRLSLFLRLLFDMESTSVDIEHSIFKDSKSDIGYKNTMLKRVTLFALGKHSLGGFLVFLLDLKTTTTKITFGHSNRLTHKGTFNLSFVKPAIILASHNVRK